MYILYSKEIRRNYHNVALEEEDGEDADGEDQDPCPDAQRHRQVQAHLLHNQWFFVTSKTGLKIKFSLSLFI